MMGELSKFIKDLRESVATASMLTISDDVGILSQELGTKVGKCEMHLDGVKSLIKRMKAKIIEYGPKT
jgi:hypothetical protein